MRFLTYKYGEKDVPWRIDRGWGEGVGTVKDSAGDKQQNHDRVYRRCF